MSITAKSTVTMRKVILEKIKITASEVFGPASLREMTVQESSDFIANALIYKLETYVLSQKIASDKYQVSDVRFIKTPHSWWDMFKEEKMPTWFTERYPVKYKSIRVDFHKTIQFTRRETYPKSSLMMRDDKCFMEVMGPAVIEDTIEIK